MTSRLARLKKGRRSIGNLRTPTMRYHAIKPRRRIKKTVVLGGNNEYFPNISKHDAEQRFGWIKPMSPLISNMSESMYDIINMDQFKDFALCDCIFDPNDTSMLEMTLENWKIPIWDILPKNNPNLMTLQTMLFKYCMEYDNLSRQQFPFPIFQLRIAFNRTRNMDAVSTVGRMETALNNINVPTSSWLRTIAYNYSINTLSPPPVMRYSYNPPPETTRHTPQPLNQPQLLMLNDVGNDDDTGGNDPVYVNDELYTVTPSQPSRHIRNLTRRQPLPRRQH